ncbi:hypothetical protein HED22_02275 [Thalassospira sp. HF15]|uniref:SPOR domain-containing protein n=1 Tax=Thalassospira sp. HF15 TaxID=2722755 RepID=UPI00142FC9B1|nr:SPOR domain-containing protein [Thalassospira sp. HF15]NIY74461.1 hypothetical protein [Thalassospira sp. HF15]
MSGLWFGSSSSPQEISSTSTGQSSPAEKAAFDQAACGLFFGHANAPETSRTDEGYSTTNLISLDGSPQENLLQAISYDMDGNYENARKLYVWLTATPPDTKVDLDCGQGVHLSGSINSLAQRRLVALDAASPEYARSDEIDKVVAAATVAPGPELPDPPQVERDRRFYETGGVVDAEPEAPITPVERMDMKVSANTAQLTRVERRTVSLTPDPSPSPAPRSTTAAAPSPAPETVAKLAPVAAPDPAASVRPAPVIEAPTIAGDAASTEHSGITVSSNSRPVEQGELDIVDRRPESSMIELPITTAQAPRQAPAPAPAPTPTPQQTAAPSAAQVNAPYYAVQLAAYRSRGRAETAWSDFQNASHGMLAAADHEVVSTSIEGKGLFFRLLTGMYGSSSEATRACNALKSAGTDCLVRRVTP